MMMETSFFNRPTVTSFTAANEPNPVVTADTAAAATAARKAKGRSTQRATLDEASLDYLPIRRSTVTVRARREAAVASSPGGAPGGVPQATSAFDVVHRLLDTRWAPEEDVKEVFDRIHNAYAALGEVELATTADDDPAFHHTGFGMSFDIPVDPAKAARAARRKRVAELEAAFASTDSDEGQPETVLDGGAGGDIKPRSGGGGGGHAAGVAGSPAAGAAAQHQGALASTTNSLSAGIESAVHFPATFAIPSISIEAALYFDRASTNASFGGRLASPHRASAHHRHSSSAAGGGGTSAEQRSNQVIRLTGPYRTLGNVGELVRDLFTMDRSFDTKRSSAAIAAAEDRRARLEAFVAVLVYKIGKTLEKAHDKGVTHGSLNAPNVFVTRYVTTGRVGGAKEHHNRRQQQSEATSPSAASRGGGATARFGALSDAAAATAATSTAYVWPMDVELHDAAVHRWSVTSGDGTMVPDMTTYALWAAPPPRTAEELQDCQQTFEVETAEGAQIAGEQIDCGKSAGELLAAVGFGANHGCDSDEDHPPDGAGASSSLAAALGLGSFDAGGSGGDEAQYHQHGNESVVALLGSPPPPAEAAFISPQATAFIEYNSDPRHDVWCVGQLVVELLTGMPEPPYVGPSGVSLLPRPGLSWSLAARDFVSLASGPRPDVTCRDLLDHPFVRTHVEAFRTACARGGITSTVTGDVTTDGPTEQSSLWAATETPWSALYQPHMPLQALIPPGVGAGGHGSGAFAPGAGPNPTVSPVVRSVLASCLRPCNASGGASFDHAMVLLRLQHALDQHESRGGGRDEAPTTDGGGAHSPRGGQPGTARPQNAGGGGVTSRSLATGRNQPTANVSFDVPIAASLSADGMPTLRTTAAVPTAGPASVRTTTPPPQTESQPPNAPMDTTFSRILAPVIDSLIHGTDPCAARLGAPGCSDGTSRVRIVGRDADPRARAALTELLDACSLADAAVRGFASDFMASTYATLAEIPAPAASFATPPPPIRLQSTESDGGAEVSESETGLESRGTTTVFVDGPTPLSSAAEALIRAEPQTTALVRHIAALTSGTLSPPLDTADLRSRTFANSAVAEGLVPDPTALLSPSRQASPETTVTGPTVNVGTSGAPPPAGGGADPRPRATAIDMCNFVYAKWAATSFSADSAAILQAVEARAGCHSRPPLVPRPLGTTTAASGGDLHVDPALLALHGVGFGAGGSHRHGHHHNTRGDTGPNTTAAPGSVSGAEAPIGSTGGGAVGAGGHHATSSFLSNTSSTFYLQRGGTTRHHAPSAVRGSSDSDGSRTPVHHRSPASSTRSASIVSHRERET